MQLVSDAAQNPAVEFPAAHKLHEYVAKANQWIEQVGRLLSSNEGPGAQQSERAQVKLEEMAGLLAQAKDLRLSTPLVSELSAAFEALSGWQRQASEILQSNPTIEQIEQVLEGSQETPVVLSEKRQLTELVGKVKMAALLAFHLPRV